MVRESMMTVDCFSSARERVRCGVGNLGLPIDAGIWRTTCPSMLTVNVWASMSATPTTEAPVWKLVFAPPAVTVMVECAGQNPFGFHCTTRSLSQVKVPVGVFGEVNAMVLLGGGAIGDGPGERHRHRMRDADRPARRRDTDDVGRCGDARRTGRDGPRHGDRREAGTRRSARIDYGLQRSCQRSQHTSRSASHSDSPSNRSLERAGQIVSGDVDCGRESRPG